MRSSLPVISLEALYHTLRTVFMTDFGAEGQVWIFPAKRVIVQEEQAFLRQRVDFFTSEWKAHGVLLEAQYYFLFDRFLIIVAYADNPASGCAIDSLFSFVKALDEQLQAGFLDRKYITYWQAGSLITDTLSRVQAFVAKNGAEEMYYFHNGLNKWADLRSAWLRPVKGSWIMPSLHV